MHRLSQIMARREKLGSGLVGKCELKGALLKPAFKRFNGPGFHCITPAPDGAGLGRPSKAPCHRSNCGLIKCRSREPKSSIGVVSANPINTLMFLRPHAPVEHYGAGQRRGAITSLILGSGGDR